MLVTMQVNTDPSHYPLQMQRSQYPEVEAAIGKRVMTVEQPSHSNHLTALGDGVARIQPPRLHR